MIGTIVGGKYRVVRLLGQGGMGAVYEALHDGTQRRVALKVIVPEALAAGGDTLARFQREARASGRVDSQHVVQVLDSGVDAATSTPFIVMEYLSGEDLLESVTRLGPLAPDLVLRVIAQSCLGLQRAHDEGLVHRDIKSANLYLARREAGVVVAKVLDFGIAKVRSDQLTASQEHHGLTRTGTMLGSPLYMSPEQARGERTLDSRSDLWSLGVAMYEALSGRTPNGSCDTLGRLILAICSDRTRSVQDDAPWVAPEIAAIVHRALTPDPAKRFQHASEMYDAIMTLLPNGNTIHESMLAPVSSRMVASTAVRFHDSRIDRDHSAPSLAATTPQTAITMDGVGTTQSRPRRSFASRWLVALLAVPVLAVVAYFGIGRLAPHRAASTSGSASSASSTIEPQASPRTFRVEITPSDSVVEIDGAITPVIDGRVEVKGSIGSVHYLKVHLGERSSMTEVVLAESGPRPSSISLPAVTPAVVSVVDAAARKPAPVRPTKPVAAPTASATKPSDIDRKLTFP